MAKDLRAKPLQKPWQAMEQNQTEGRGVFCGRGSDQPKPRAGRRQTAQGGVQKAMPGHAASASVPAPADITRCRMRWRLNWKVSSAEAW